MKRELGLLLAGWLLGIAAGFTISILYSNGLLAFCP